jgi:hypothetical protein
MLAYIQSRIFCLLVCCQDTKGRVYKFIILPVVLYSCEIWSLTLREQHRLGVTGFLNFFPSSGILEHRNDEGSETESGTGFSRLSWQLFARL